MSLQGHNESKWVCCVCRLRRSVAEQGRAQRPTLQSGDPTRVLAHTRSRQPPGSIRTVRTTTMYVHCSQRPSNRRDRPADTGQKLEANILAELSWKTMHVRHRLWKCAGRQQQGKCISFIHLENRVSKSDAVDFNKFKQDLNKANLWFFPELYMKCYTRSCEVLSTPHFSCWFLSHWLVNETGMWQFII